MRATLTDEQQQLEEVVGRLAADATPRAPAPMDAVPEAVPATKELLAGFAGLGVAEDAGGAGGGLLDLAVVVRQLGRRVVPTAFVSHVQAVQAAYGAGLDVAESAGGTARWTLAVEEPEASPLGPWSTTLVDGRVRGSKTAVADADAVDAVVVSCDQDGLAVTFPSAARPLGAVDLTRRSFEVDVADDTAVVGGGTGAARALQRVFILQAAELAGVGLGAVELGADYARQREQFGKPIGQFQAVAHQLADASVAIHNSWSLVLYAAWALDDGHPVADQAVHTARAHAADAAVFASERGTQVHGGIGITWEALPHLYVRRAASVANSLGTAAWHRERAARLLVS